MYKISCCPEAWVRRETVPPLTWGASTQADAQGLWVFDIMFIYVSAVYVQSPMPLLCVCATQWHTNVMWFQSCDIGGGRGITRQALSYPTHRWGLAVSRCKGVLDRGFSLCTVPTFCCSPGISSCMQVYVLPTDCREVAESNGTTEIVSGLAWSQKAEDRGSNSFGRPENIERCETYISWTRVGDCKEYAFLLLMADILYWQLYYYILYMVFRSPVGFCGWSVAI